jgi:hypothetical protein
MLNVIMLNIIMLNVVTLSVMVPLGRHCMIYLNSEFLEKNTNELAYGKPELYTTLGMTTLSIMGSGILDLDDTKGRHDTQHKDTQHKRLTRDTQHNNALPLC